MFRWLRRIFGARDVPSDGYQRRSVPALPAPSSAREGRRFRQLDPNHPLLRGLEIYMQSKPSRTFSGGSPALHKIAVGAGYNPSSWNPFLTTLIRAGIVRRKRKGVYLWIGRPQQAPAVSKAPPAANEIAERGHGWIAASSDGLNHGQILKHAIENKIPHGLTMTVLAVLIEAGRVTDVCGRYYSTAALDLMTNPVADQQAGCGM